MGEAAKIKTRVRYRCHDCDEWKPTMFCPDCGGRCAIYRRNVLSEGGRNG